VDKLSELEALLVSAHALRIETIRASSSADKDGLNALAQAPASEVAKSILQRSEG
jgi:hypothetical protein